jgi:hypothetical protein
MMATFSTQKKTHNQDAPAYDPPCPALNNHDYDQTTRDMAA